MPMTYDEQQTLARRSLWNGQHGQAIRMAEPRPDDDEEDDDDIEDEDDEDEEEDDDTEDEDDEDKEL